MSAYKINKEILARGPIHAVCPHQWARYAIGESALALEEMPEDDEIEYSGRIALMSVSGACYYKTGIDKKYLRYFYALEWAYVLEELEELVNDPRVSSVVIDMDSPGGVVFGTPEAAERMRELASKKRVVVYANPGVFSAAYWVASQASAVYVLPSGYVGSIGTLIIHQDWSGYYADRGIVNTVIRAPERKAETIDLEPLSEDAKKRLEEDASRIYEKFVRDVALGRGVSEDYVRQNFGKGGVLNSEQALKVGAVDGIMSLEQIIAAELDRASGITAKENSCTVNLTNLNKIKLELLEI